MDRIEEEYVSFETAKLLKEKGFNGPCFVYYNEFIDNWRTLKIWRRYPKTYDTVKNDGYILVPTHQMAMKYLREVHNRNIILYMVPEGDDSYVLWTFNVLANKNSKIIFGDKQPKYKTYEEACETAIKYCLENLI